MELFQSVLTIIMTIFYCAALSVAVSPELTRGCIVVIITLGALAYLITQDPMTFVIVTLSLVWIILGKKVLDKNVASRRRNN